MTQPLGGFEAIVREVSEEPLLGPQQQALVSALIQRLREGPPLSDPDEATATWLARTLRL